MGYNIEAEALERAGNNQFRLEEVVREITGDFSKAIYGLALRADHDLYSKETGLSLARFPKVVRDVREGMQRLVGTKEDKVGLYRSRFGLVLPPDHDNRIAKIQFDVLRYSDGGIKNLISFSGTLERNEDTTKESGWFTYPHDMINQEVSVLFKDNTINALGVFHQDLFTRKNCRHTMPTFGEEIGYFDRVNDSKKSFLVGSDRFKYDPYRNSFFSPNGKEKISARDYVEFLKTILGNVPDIPSGQELDINDPNRVFHAWLLPKYKWDAKLRSVRDTV